MDTGEISENRINPLLKCSEIIVIPDTEFALDEFPESFDLVQIRAVRGTKASDTLSSAASFRTGMQRWYQNYGHRRKSTLVVVDGNLPAYTADLSRRNIGVVGDSQHTGCSILECAKHGTALPAKERFAKRRRRHQTEPRKSHSGTKSGASM